MADTLIGTSLAVATLMSLTAFICWRKLALMQALAADASAREQKHRKNNEQLERELQRANERWQLQKDLAAKAEKSQVTAKQRAESEMRLASEKVAHAEDALATAELKIEHLRAQVDVMTQQLREADTAIKTLQTETSYAASRAEKSIEAEVSKLKTVILDERKKASQLQLKLETLASENVRIKNEKLNQPAADPEKMAELQRKLLHINALYKAMRGQREMAEERNRNWEIALKKLSSWVLVQNKSKTDPSTTSIGPIVGEALNLIGESLLEDEFSATNAPSTLHAPIDNAAAHQ